MALPKCHAHNRAGEPCGKPAGWGTDHVGFGLCKAHGGLAPAGKIQAKRLQAEAAVATYGLPVEIGPREALEGELWRSEGYVRWLASYVAHMEERDIKQYARGEDGTRWERPSVWIELLARERKHLREVAKTCHDCGIDERRMQIAEQQGQIFATAIRSILADLGVADHPQAPAIVRRHLMLVRADAA